MHRDLERIFLVGKSCITSPQRSVFLSRFISVIM